MRSQALVLLIPCVAITVLIADMVLGWYGLYLELGISPVRTLIVPAIEFWVAMVFLAHFVYLLRASWPALGTTARTAALLFVPLLILALEGGERLHKSVIAEIDAELASALRFGRSARIKDVDYKWPLTQGELSVTRCELMPGPLQFNYVREVNATCGNRVLSATIIYRLSTAKVSVRMGW